MGYVGGIPLPVMGNVAQAPLYFALQCYGLWVMGPILPIPQNS